MRIAEVCAYGESKNMEANSRRIDEIKKRVEAVPLPALAVFSY